MSENNEIKEPSNKNNKVPKIRFSKFNDAWEYKELKDISKDNSYGLNASSKKYDGFNKYIRITDIDDETNNFLHIDLTSPDCELDDFYKLKSNDLLFARTGASTGKTYLYSSDDGNVYFAGYLIRFRINKTINASFIFFQTKTKKFQNWIKIYSKRSGQPGINAYEYGKYRFALCSIEEQNKIAIFLDILDKKMKFLKAKIETLKKYKEGIIKNLVNRSNKHVRFLNLISLYDKTRLPSSIGKESGKYKFFINSSNEETKWSDDYIFDGEYIIMNTGGSAYTNYINGKFSAMSDCLIIKPQNRYSIALYYWLKAKERMIDKVGFQGTGLKHLDLNWLLRKNISLIEYNNKKLIKLNASLDYLINLNSLMLAKLIRVKKGLLDTMFI